ncbi:MAG: isoprenylcysteine carboxylmethyltransferase family protein [Gammaproteobacteria bacterium]|nr:isoprenylcysteine carboxylmethyltransferase family protein [Gammaproteobacteria bacterium]
MKRTLILLFGIACYVSFLPVFLYLYAFLANLQMTGLAEQWPILKTLVPYSIDYGREMGNPVAAVLINLGLIALFGIQHSVMARQGFKRAWTRIVPPAAERPMYVLVTSLVLVVMYWQWRPIDHLLWNAESSVGIGLGYGILLLGLALVLLSTFLINHFHLFGLQQVVWNFLGKVVPAAKFRTPFLYRIVRHPLYTGLFLSFWATPAMSCGHLLFALGMSAYLFIGIRYEEKDLKEFHPEYEKYAEQVPMLAPVPGRSYKG